jgi:hypothetical protein
MSIPNKDSVAGVTEELKWLEIVRQQVGLLQFGPV